MQLRLEWLALYVAVAALYVLVAWREWDDQRPGSVRAPTWHAVVLALAIVLHGTLLFHGMFESGELRFGFAHALSATLWITALIVCVETAFSPSRGMFLLVLPLTAIAVLLPTLFPGAVVGRSSGSPLFQVHLLLAILAYSLLTIAAIHALLMATGNVGCMAKRPEGRGRPPLSSMSAPLLAMEVFCFR